MFRIFVFAGIIVCLLAAGAHAGLAKFQLPAFSPTQVMNAPAVSVGPDGWTMVAYSTHDVVLMNFIEVQAILTREPGWPAVLPDPVTLGPGYAPYICWTREGWICAFSSAGMLRIAESDVNGVWDTDGVELIPIGGGILKMDLWGAASDAAGPDAFLVIERYLDPPDGGFETLYMSRTTAGWSEPELIVPESSRLPYPQVTYTWGPAGPMPQIYYLDWIEDQTELMTTYLDPMSGWSTPAAVPGDGVSSPTEFTGDFEVIRHGTGQTEILGLGPMPTCPCRDMLFQEYDNGWQPTVVVTAPVDRYNTAFLPNLVCDDLGKSYAFWVQEGADPALVPHSRTLQYRIRSGGEWENWDTLFDDQRQYAPGVVSDIDVSPIGEPVMAWTRTDTLEGVPQPERIWIAQISGPATVPDERTHEAASLAAWPNPFNPRVSLTVEPSVAGPVRLDIHDAKGRRVRNLLDVAALSEVQTVSWDGTDAAGRELPSGIYFARAVTAQGAVVKKLVLAR